VQSLEKAKVKLLLISCVRKQDKEGREELVKFHALELFDLQKASGLTRTDCLSDAKRLILKTSIICFLNSLLRIEYNQGLTPDDAKANNSAQSQTKRISIFVQASLVVK